MSKKQSVGKNAIFLSVEPIIFGIVGVAVAGYVARNLGASEYGKLVFVLSFINFFTLFTNLGFNNYLMNTFSTHPEKAETEFFSILITRAVLALLTYLAGAIVINLMGFPVDTAAIYYAAGIIIFPLYIEDSCNGIFKGREKMQYIAYLMILHSFLLHLLRVVIVFLGYKAYALAWTRVSISLFLMCIGLTIIYTRFINIRLNFSLRIVKKVVTGTLPFAFSTSFLIIYNRIDVIMLSYFAGDESVAYYKTANLFVEKLSIITVAIVGAVYPAVSRLHQREHNKALRLYSRTFLYLFVISIPMAVGGFMLSSQIIDLIFGTKFNPAVAVARILFGSIPIVFATSIMGNVLMAINEAKLFSYIMTVLCLANIGFNLFLIPIYAEVGAAMATLIAQVLNALLLTYFTSRKFGMFRLDVKFIKVLLSSAAMAFIVKAMLGMNLFLIVIAGALTYLLFIMAMRTFNKEELIELKNIVTPNRKRWF